MQLPPGSGGPPGGRLCGDGRRERPGRAGHHRAGRTGLARAGDGGRIAYRRRLMVEEDVYCIDVLTQVSAVTRALQAVALGLLEDHLDACVSEAVRQGGDEGRASVHEAAEAISRLVRS